MKALLFFLLLLNVCQSLDQKGSGLSRMQVVFLETSNTAHVLLKVSLKEPLTGFTICLKHWTDLNRAHSLFSYATRNSHDDILIYKYKSNQYYLYVGGRSVSFWTPEKQLLERETLCATWNSTTGLARLWVNGERFLPKRLNRGYSISPNSSIVLGQDQDSMRGGFNSNECYVGEMQDVRMWGRVLSPEEMNHALLDDDIPGDTMIDWETVDYEVKGGAIVEHAWLP